MRASGPTLICSTPSLCSKKRCVPQTDSTIGCLALTRPQPVSFGCSILRSPCAKSLCAGCMRALNAQTILMSMAQVSGFAKSPKKKKKKAPSINRPLNAKELMVEISRSRNCLVGQSHSTAGSAGPTRMAENRAKSWDAPPSPIRIE